MKKKINKKKNSMSASDIGRMGGNAVATKHGKGHMSTIGKKGALARWGNKNASKK